MNFRRTFLALISSSTLLLTDCGGGATTPPIATITISPQITSLAINGTQTFTAIVTGTSAKYVTWVLDVAGSGVAGSFSGSGVLGTIPGIEPGTASGPNVTFKSCQQHSIPALPLRWSTRPSMTRSARQAGFDIRTVLPCWYPDSPSNPYFSEGNK